MKLLALVLGVVLVVLGLVWFLQGVGVMGGTAMSGSSTWAVTGPIVAVVGIVLVVLSRRSARRG